MSLEIKDLTLTFPDGDNRITAVDKASMKVDSGELAVITGPSGSGKSSLLAATALLITTDSGEIFLDDKEVSKLNDAEKTKIRGKKMGMIFQSSNLIPSITVLEQLLLVNKIAQVPQDKDYAMELLKEVGMDDQVYKLPSQLSGGQQQRVNIARALMNNASLLIVDEPTSALDSKKSKEIVELIKRLTVEKKTATLMVTHNETDLKYADSNYQMLDGTLTNVN
ncbi:MAG: ABC transporter ATP-binding protein [Micrococcaceae bacterium]